MRRSLALLVLLASCEDDPPPSLPPDASVHAADAAPVLVETECDGADNNGDRVVDLLLPVLENSCTTTSAGECGRGFSACERNERVCMTPTAVPEAKDGLDNDCNGVVDDTASEPKHPRMTLLIPEYLWTEVGTDLKTIAELLRSWGVPFDMPIEGSGWDATLASLDNYALAFIPGYLVGGAIDPAAKSALERFVENGGVLVITRPVGSALTSSIAINLAGLSASERRFDLGELRFDGDPAPAISAFDSPEERTVLVTDDVMTKPIEIYALTADPRANTRVLAHAYGSGVGPVPTITYRKLGRGAVYALGHDLLSFDHYRCYINCFEPGRDQLALFLRDALREGAGGHTIFLHTVPGDEDSALLLTHDVDAPDAQREGSWGEPGALQIADVEAQHGARGSYYVTTDYVIGYYNPNTVTELCRRGMCPIGAHSVRHAENFQTQDVGTCTETFDNYLPNPEAPTTLCGEVRVSTELLVDAVGAAPRIWRTPYLRVHPSQYSVLAANGYIADSSFAIGDFKLSLPFSLEKIGFRQELFDQQPIYELLIAIEDGIGYFDDQGVEQRIELQPDYFEQFMTNWEYVMLRHAANRTVTVALIHPSYGIGQGPENLPTKVAAVDRLLEIATASGVKVDVGVDAFIEFWRARSEVSFDAMFDGAVYRGELVTGSFPITNLVLELGDQIASFECASCGAHRIRGRRVVLESTLAANTRYEFTATP